MILGNFSDEADVCRQMAFTDEQRQNRTIVYAQYSQIDYDGDATVIYLEDGKLYQINASHCSCFSLSEADCNKDAFEIDFETLKGFCERGVSAYGANYNYVMDYLQARNNVDPTDLDEFFAPLALSYKISSAPR